MQRAAFAALEYHRICIDLFEVLMDSLDQLLFGRHPDAAQHAWARGDMIVVRYADDAVLGFERRGEAEAFLEQLRERMQKFGLELHPEKTRL